MTMPDNASWGNNNNHLLLLSRQSARWVSSSQWQLHPALEDMISMFSWKVTVELLSLGMEALVVPYGAYLEAVTHFSFLSARPSDQIMPGALLRW